MKSCKILIAVGAFALLGVLNFTYSESVFAMSQAQATSSSSSSKPQSSTSSSKPKNTSSSKPKNTSGSQSTSNSSSNSNNPCCKPGGGVCNQKTSSVPSKIKCTITTTKWTNAAGEVYTEVKGRGGLVTATGKASAKGDKSDKQVTTKVEEFTDTKVSCPTIGKCNDCKEYTPDC